MDTWIFQGNPSYYAIRAAVRELREIAWRTNQYKDRIQTGDRVYIWESGRDSGIAAVACVLDRSRLMRQELEERAFVLDPAMLPDDVFRARLRITHIVEPELPPAQIRNHPELAGLLILRRPQATNFPVTDQEATALEQMLEQHGTIARR